MTYSGIYFIGEADKASDESLYREIGYSDAHLIQQRKAFEALGAGTVSDEEHDLWIKTDVEEL